MIDQIIGNPWPPICNVNKSGNAKSLANQTPTRAPMNPSAMDTSQPPRETPTIICPRAPQTPATTSNRSKSIIDMSNPFPPGTSGAVAENG